MKTVRVISEFVDKFNPARHYVPGEVVKFDDERVADMVARQLAVVMEDTKKVEPKPEVKAEPKVESKPKPVIAKPLKKEPKEETDGTKKGK